MVVFKRRRCRRREKVGVDHGHACMHGGPHPHSHTSLRFCIAHSTLFTIVSLMEGRGFDYVQRKIESQFFRTMKVDLIMWPIVQTINFALVPAKFRVLYIGILNLLWNGFLCYVQKYVSVSHTRSLSL